MTAMVNSMANSVNLRHSRYDYYNRDSSALDFDAPNTYNQEESSALNLDGPDLRMRILSDIWALKSMQKRLHGYRKRRCSCKSYGSSSGSDKTRSEQWYASQLRYAERSRDKEIQKRKKWFESRYEKLASEAGLDDNNPYYQMTSQIPDFTQDHSHDHYQQLGNAAVSPFVYPEDQAGREMLQNFASFLAYEDAPPLPVWPNQPVVEPPSSQLPLDNYDPFASAVPTPIYQDLGPQVQAAQQTPSDLSAPEFLPSKENAKLFDDPSYMPDLSGFSTLQGTAESGAPQAAPTVAEIAVVTGTLEMPKTEPAEDQQPQPTPEPQQGSPEITVEAGADDDMTALEQLEASEEQQPVATPEQTMESLDDDGDKMIDPMSESEPPTMEENSEGAPLEQPMEEQEENQPSGGGDDEEADSMEPAQILEEVPPMVESTTETMEKLVEQSEPIEMPMEDPEPIVMSLEESMPEVTQPQEQLIDEPENLDENPMDLTEDQAPNSFQSQESFSSTKVIQDGDVITDEQTSTNTSGEAEKSNDEFFDEFLKMDDFWLEDDDDFWLMEPSQINSSEEPIEVATGTDWWNKDDMLMIEDESGSQ